jgi:hypothetical protein
LVYYSSTSPLCREISTDKVERQIIRFWWVEFSPLFPLREKII